MSRTLLLGTHGVLEANYMKEEIFQEFIKRLTAKKVNEVLVDKLKTMWNNGELTSEEKILNAIIEVNEDDQSKEA